MLQLIPLLRETGGEALVSALLEEAGLTGPPPDTGLMDEAPAAALHLAVRRHLPGQAPAILAEAGRRTADYILAHRIPRPVQTVLRGLPAWAAAPILTRAIARHAWTFAGSGRFLVAGPLRFEIASNPLIRGETADHPLCDWHVAVFERLFRSLVDDRLRATETACCACGDAACRISLHRERAS